MATKSRLVSCDVDRLAREYRRTGDVELRNRIVEEYNWFAERCARRFSGRGEPLGDLTQVARLGLVKAADRYDPERPTTFESYARPTIDGEIRRHFRDRTWALSVSRTSKDLRSLVLGTRERLEQRIGRPPTVDEIATAANLDPDAVTRTVQANAAYRTTSIDRGTGDHGNIADRIAANGGSETVERLAMITLVRDLDDRSRKIVYWYYFEDRTQKDIGSALGIGQVQVSRLLKAALRQLRASAELDVALADSA